MNKRLSIEQLKLRMGLLKIKTKYRMIDACQIDMILNTTAFCCIENAVYLTKMEFKIFMLLATGFTRKKICKVLEIKRHTLRQHLNRIRYKGKKSS